jgi:hypothetical protein
MEVGVAAEQVIHLVLLLQVATALRLWLIKDFQEAMLL